MTRVVSVVRAVGPPGREVELGEVDGALVWRYVGESAWVDLVDLPALVAAEVDVPVAARIADLDSATRGALDVAVAADAADPGTALGGQLRATYVRGESIALQALPLADAAIAATSVVPFDVLDGLLYGAEGAAIKRSADHGATWTTVTTMSAGAMITGIRAAGDGEVLVIRHTDGLYRSQGWATNPSTATFTRVLQPSTGAYLLPWGVDVSPTGKVVVAEYTPSYVASRYVSLSTDHGATFAVIWDKTTEPLITDPNATHLHFAAFDPWENDRIYISWHHSSPASPRGVFYTDDEGETWETLVMGYQPTTCTPTDAGLVFASDEIAAGVYVVQRSDPSRAYRHAWKWVESPTGGLPGFGYRGFRDPDTGIVYTCWVGYSGNPRGMITASDGRTAAPVWRASEIVTTDSDGARNVVVLDGRVIAAILVTDGSSTWRRLVATVPTVGARVASADDRGQVLTGTVSDVTSVAGGAGARAAGTKGTALGVGATAGGTTGASTAIGYAATAATNDSVAVGGTASGAAATALGGGATASGGQSVAAGQAAQATGTLAVAVGRATAAGHSRAVALGSTVATSAADQVAIGPRHIEIVELAADAGAPAVGRARLFVRVNGAGKTEVCVRFNTGVVQVIATEP